MAYNFYLSILPPPPFHCLVLCMLLDNTKIEYCIEGRYINVCHRRSFRNNHVGTLNTGTH